MKLFPVKTIGKPVAADLSIAVQSVGRTREQTGALANQDWHIPEETPVAFVYNRHNYAVMLASPQDMADYALGFSLTEGVVSCVSSILSLDIHYTDHGIDLRVRLDQTSLEKLQVRQRRRLLVGTAGCGLCGLESADSLFQPLPQVASTRTTLKPIALAVAMAALAGVQPLNEKTRTVHGAAWVSHEGRILLLREDVGRHNALDKLLGALALAGTKMKTGFVLMTSRCSYELVEKAARCGVQALATLSGPTGLAVQKAKEANLSLYVRDGTGAVCLNEAN